jgi:hypothetical protein
MSDKPRCASCSDRAGATTRRGIFRWFGSVMAATTAWGLATLTGQPRVAAESPPAVPTHPAPPCWNVSTGEGGPATWCGASIEELLEAQWRSEAGLAPMGQPCQRAVSMHRSA